MTEAERSRLAAIEQRDLAKKIVEMQSLGIPWSLKEQDKFYMERYGVPYSPYTVSPDDTFEPATGRVIHHFVNEDPSRYQGITQYNCIEYYENLCRYKNSRNNNQYQNRNQYNNQYGSQYQNRNSYNNQYGNTYQNQSNPQYRYNKNSKGFGTNFDKDNPFADLYDDNPFANMENPFEHIDDPIDWGDDDFKSTNSNQNTSNKNQNTSYRNTSNTNTNQTNSNSNSNTGNRNTSNNTNNQNKEYRNSNQNNSGSTSNKVSEKDKQYYLYIGIFGWEVNKEFTLSELKKRYHFLAKNFHPDGLDEKEANNYLTNLNGANEYLQKFATDYKK